ncbi:MAG TPA: cell division protein ZipA C-terminal FtsZ-binding domain-containing protein [Burkholderiales bacterium]|nr:cell division protein ZipA C-terminal FtsZ-binding domain-containing protein [Burkholderiales bacterium]
MGDLVLGLLVLGAVLFAGVLVYNRVQERSARRAVERAFGPGRPDTLLDEPSARREPSLKAEALPDERVDYVIELQPARPLAAAMVHEGWQTIEQRFARRVLLAESGGGDWRAGLQLVSRAGVVSEAELIEFRSAVETLAASLAASVSAPEIRHVLEAARELDRTCADSDIQVALHVVAPAVDIDSAPLVGEQPFQVVRREDGVTLILDVALTPQLGASYEAMARAGRSLAETHGGRLVDDRGNVLDERSLAAIGAQLEAVRQALAGRGIETGSPLALRLFS